MALAGEQDDVAGRRPLECRLDRRGRSGIASTSTPRRLPAASAPATISSMIASRSSPRGSSSVAHDEPAALAGDPAHPRPAWRCRARRPTRTRRSARRPAPRRAAPAGRAPSRARPGSARSRRRPPNGWPCVDPLHPAGHALDALEPRADRAGSRPSPSPNATTASALWTLNRPASRSSSAASPDGAAYRTRSRRASSSTPVARTSAAASGAVRHDRRPRLAGGGLEPGRGRVVAVDDRDLGPRAAARPSSRGFARAVGERREQAQLRRAVAPRTSRGGRGARGSDS